MLVGGSPTKVLRFATPVDLDGPLTPATRRRLVDAGMAHPRYDPGPTPAGAVTVVVPCRDDPVALGATLEGLASTLAGSDIVASVIVVDDGSRRPDLISEVVGRITGVEVRLVRRPRNGGPAAARNTGLDEVSSPYVAFIDAGCVPGPGWLPELLAAFGDPEVVMAAPRVAADPHRHVTAPGTPGGRMRSWLSRRIAQYEQSRSPLDLGAEPARVSPRTRVAYVPSACLLASTADLREAGGFDVSMRVGEDVDLVWRMADRHRVRYEPTARATHDVRVSPTSWLTRRYAYGTSAAPLATRHPGAVAPVVMSRWSFAAWMSVAVGRPLVGVAIATTSTGLLARRLRSIPGGTASALRLAGLGNLAAARLVADALRRPWWPLAVMGTVFGGRALRRTMIAALVVPPLAEWRPSTGLDPATWWVLRTADDLAYGTGVLVGAWQHRTAGPLMPALEG